MKRSAIEESAEAEPDHPGIRFTPSGLPCYRGKNNWDGHFDLAAPERKGRASLHCFPNSHFMEGYWQEEDVRGVRGMWRIHLK